MYEIYSLRCQRLVAPLAVDHPEPRLSWRVRSHEPARSEPSGFELEVREADKLIWAAEGQAGSCNSVDYAGPRLRPRTRYDWRVRLTEGRAASDWASAYWISALLPEAGWSAEWVGAPAQPDRPRRGPLLVRRLFHLSDLPERVLARVTALGLYELWINGQRVGGPRVLSPGWTDYRTRVHYQALDVAPFLRRGANVVGAYLGDGWFSGRIGLADQAGAPEWGIYGRRPRFFLQLETVEGMRSQVLLKTDATWRYSPAPLLEADILDGERCDLRLDDPRWATADLDDSSWPLVATGSESAPALNAESMEPVAITAELAPKEVRRTADGRYLVDFGQNIAGWCRLALTGEAGAAARIRHGEALEEDGELYRGNLRIEVPGMPGAAQEDVVILAGTRRPQSYEPRFTYHGFRYVEVAGPVALQSVRAAVVHSDLTSTLTLECSEPLLERLVEAIRWTLRGNLVSIPTDCPQRDERLGWAGDTQVVAPALLTFFDAAAFLEKWLRDLRDAQTPEGCFPDFAPHPFGPLEPPRSEFYGNPGWADAGVLVPWAIYQSTGDDRVLAEALDSAARWVDYVAERNPSNLWENRPAAEYGDWLNGGTLILDGWSQEGCAVDTALSATAFFYRSARVVEQMARVLGRNDLARRYGLLARRIREAFNRGFCTPAGQPTETSQAAYAFALGFDLLPTAARAAALSALAEEVDRRDGRPTTGIQSTPLLLDQLTKGGRTDLAYRILLSREIPSWGYMLDHGATTIWERWDGYVPGRGFQNPRMNSLNHCAFGAIGDWIVRNVGGIAPAAPGYRRVLVAPKPWSDDCSTRCSYLGESGEITVEWKQSGERLDVDVDLPPGVQATVRFPSGRTAFVARGRRLLRSSG